MMLIFDAAAILVYSLACLGAGSIGFHFLSPPEKSSSIPSGMAVFAIFFLLGQGILANLWLLVALPGWFNPYVIVGVLALCLLGGAFYALPFLPGLGRSLQNEGAHWLAAAWYLKLIIILALLLCLSGLTRLGHPLMGDATATYLTLPKVLAASHHFRPLVGPYEDFTVRIGLQGEMHFAALMSLGLHDEARIFDWVTLLVAAVMLVSVCAQAGLGRKGRWLAFTMFYTSTAILYLVCSGKVDLFALAMGLAAVYWAIRDKDWGLRLTGLFTGLAILSKLSYGISFLPVVVSLVLCQIFFGEDESEEPEVPWSTKLLLGVKSIARLSFWTILPLLPHLIKVFIWLGNPLQQAELTFVRQDRVRFPTPFVRRIVATFPLSLTFGNFPGQHGNLSAMVLAFLPSVLLLPKPSSLKSFLQSRLTQITLTALLGLIAWVIVRPSGFQLRYFLVTIVLFIPLAARGGEYILNLKKKNILLKSLVVFCSLLTIYSVSSTMFVTVYHPLKTFNYLTGQMPQWKRDGQYYQAYNVLNQSAPKGSRILFLAFHAYWLRPDLLQCLSDQQEVRAWDSDQSPEKRWSFVYKKGFDYLIIDKVLRKYSLRYLTQLPKWVRLTKVYDQSLVVIYKLGAVNPPVKPSFTCRQPDPPAWQVEKR